MKGAKTDVSAKNNIEPNKSSIIKIGIKYLFLVFFEYSINSLINEILLKIKSSISTVYRSLFFHLFFPNRKCYNLF